MASIEVSLSTTPRRKKNGSIGSAAGVTAAAQTNGVVANNSAYRPSLSLSLAPSPAPGHAGHAGHATPSNAAPSPASNRDLGRELDALRNALRDKENLIQR